MKKLSIILFSVTLVLGLVVGLVPPHSAAKEVPELRNLAPESSYEWSVEPEPQYADPGNKLTDGEYGALQFWDAPWVGHLRGKTRSVIFDLGGKKSIARVQAHFLQDSPSGIAFPNTVSVYVSNDKEKWGTLAHLHNQEARWAQGPATEQTFEWDGEEHGFLKGNPNATMAHARYVKVTFTTETWVFIDEVEIWGTDGKAKWAKNVPPDHPKYLKAGEATGGIHNLALLYNGHYAGGEGDWTKERILPYISYVNEEGEPEDWLFDGILYLGLLTPQYHSFETGSALLEEWQWYLDKTFAPDGDMAQLNEAVTEAGAKLGDDDHKVKVVIMIPYTGDSLTDFGDVDGDGISENFNSSVIGHEAAYANKEKAVRWWMDQVQERWEEGNYDRLEWTGMYWLSEGVSNSNAFEGDFIRDTSKLVHENGLKFFWIPYFQGNQNFAWKELGFDAAALQPNHFFPASSDPIRVEDAAELAAQYHMGIEIELDERMNTDPERRQRYLHYLNGGIDFGYMKDAFKAYYQGNLSLYDSSRSDDPIVRQNYDWMYQFVKGTYEKQPLGPDPQ